MVEQSPKGKLGYFNPTDVQSCAGEWEDYKRLFLVHLDAKGLYNADGQRKVGKLLEKMGPDHVRTYDTFQWNPAVAAVPADPANGIEARAAIPAENKYDLDCVFAKFDTHFGVHKFRSIKRQEFLNTVRNPKQSIMNFIADLRSKARYCNYGDLEDSFICDQIINKVAEPKVTEKLMGLEDDELTLPNVMRVCRQVELTNAHLDSMKKQNQGEKDVHKVFNRSRGRSRGHGRSNFPRHRGTSRPHSDRYHQDRYQQDRHGGRFPKCQKCCKNHTPDYYCKADNEYCGSCGTKGHFKNSSLCRNYRPTNPGRNRSHSNYSYNRQYRPRGEPRSNNFGSRPNNFRGRGRRNNVHFTENHDTDDYYHDNYYDENDPMNEMFDMFDAMHCDVYCVNNIDFCDENLQNAGDYDENLQSVDDYDENLQNADEYDDYDENLQNADVYDENLKGVDVSVKNVCDVDDEMMHNVVYYGDSVRNAVVFDETSYIADVYVDDVQSETQSMYNTLNDYSDVQSEIPGVNNVDNECNGVQNEIPNNDNEFTTDAYVCVNNGHKDSDNDFYATLSVNGKGLQVELDTGAKCNILSFKSLEELDVNFQLLPSQVLIRGVHGQSVKAKGIVRLPCAYKQVRHIVEFQVLDGNVNLLGRADCVKFGLVARVNKAVTSDTEFMLTKFADVFADRIGCLPGEYEIKIDESATPVIHPPRSVPSALRDKVKDELNRLENAEIIAKVTEPTPWVNSMVVVNKKNSDRVRICIDPSDLNKAILREHFPMNNIDDIVTRLHGSKYFTTLDANMGYFQIKLSQRSSYLTTFNTPFGRYRNLRMPMGAKCSAEKFQSALVDAFGNIDGVEVYQDDILIHGRTREEHNNRLLQVLKKCREINLVLNKKKCQIGKSEVTYVGHRLTSEGLRPTEDRVKAISNLQAPTDVKELETVLGMIAYVAKFVPRLSELTAPLRELKREEDWCWTDKHQRAFELIKRELTSERILKYYDVNKPIIISVDASCKGLGAAAIQNGAVVAYASRALTPTEQKYAQIEKEMLAVVYGCTKFHKLIYGKNDVTVESDHKPLESLLKKPMSASPMRIQRMRLKLEPYSFNLIHVNGKSIGLADCLSRFPQQMEKDDIVMDEELMVCKIDTLAHQWHSKIEEATRADDEFQQLRRIIFNGWPENKQDVPPIVTPYWHIRDQLSTYNGIIFKGERIVIPTSLRGEILQLLHSSHLGIVKTKQRARDMIYWPGLNSQIEEMTRNCAVCQQNQRKQQKEPMTIHPLPSLPWNKVGVDLFDFEGAHYLLCVDYYSNFIEVAPLNKDTRSCAVIKHLKINIARYGIMETLISDNGPQFISKEFSDFCQKYKINHVTSSPTHQQSNGLAEEGVRQIKELMRKCKESGEDFCLALLDLRNTPRDDKIGSPMQRLQGRRAQTRLPILDSRLKPSTIEPNTVHDKMMEYRRKQKFYYDRNAKQLPELKKDAAVRVWTPNGWKPAEYQGKHPLPNSHVIRAGDQGLTYRRNRKHLLMTGEEPHRAVIPEPPRTMIPPMRPQTRRPVPRPQGVNQPLNQVPTRDPTRPPIRPPSPPNHQPPARPSRERRTPVWMKDYTK